MDDRILTAEQVESEFDNWGCGYPNPVSASHEALRVRVTELEAERHAEAKRAERFIATDPGLAVRLLTERAEAAERERDDARSAARLVGEALVIEEARVAALTDALREWIDAEDHVNDEVDAPDDPGFWRRERARAAARAVLGSEAPSPDRVPTRTIAEFVEHGTTMPDGSETSADG